MQPSIQYVKQTTHFLQQPNPDNYNNLPRSQLRNNFGSNYNHSLENREKHFTHCCCSKINNRYSSKCRIESRVMVTFKIIL